MPAGQGLISACWALAVTQFPQSCTFRVRLEDKPLGVEPLQADTSVTQTVLPSSVGNGLHQAVMEDTLWILRPPML